MSTARTSPLCSTTLEIPSTQPSRVLLTLMASDSVALLLAVALTVLGKGLITGDLEIHNYLRLVVFLPAFLAAYAAAGFYSGLSLGSPEEVRRCTVCSSLMFILLSTVTVSIRGATAYVKPTVFVAIALTGVFVPLFRSAVRSLLGRRDWWGYRAIILGTPDAAASVAREMLRNPGLGLKPVAIIYDGPHGSRRVCGVPVVTSHELLQNPDLPEDTYIVLTKQSCQDAPGAVEACQERFSRVLLIHESFPGLGNLLVTPRALGGLLGLEMSQHALMAHKQFAKRIFDLTLAALIAPVVFPLIVLISIWITLDSKGPVFFSQKRIGRGGRMFSAWKFRTMVVNAAEVLEEHLKNDPALRFEWERNHKLKDDPRVTRAGQFLRKASLDETPQLWNVVKGEMSLVGPRPIVQAEVSRYGSRFAAYTKVPGGITGLWQVSGRNDTTYEERVSLDAYYVRNWSVWLDLYILFRTVNAVLFRKGAY